MKRIKIFENFIDRWDEQLYDIFEDIDLDLHPQLAHDVKVDVLSVFDSVFSVRISFVDKVGIKNILDALNDKINMAKSMGFITYDGFDRKDVYGRLSIKFTFSNARGRECSLPLSDSDRGSGSIFMSPEEYFRHPLTSVDLYYPPIIKNLDIDIYSKFDRVYKVEGARINFQIDQRRVK